MPQSAELCGASSCLKQYTSSNVSTDHDQSIITLGGISFVFLGIFLFLIYDFSTSKEQTDKGLPDERDERIKNSSSHIDFSAIEKRGLKLFLRQSIYKSVKTFFSQSREFINGSELYFFADNQNISEGLKIYKNGSVFILSTASQSLPESLIDSIRSGLIVRMEEEVYIPLNTAGFLSYVYLPQRYSENEISIIWEKTNELAEVITSDLIKSLDEIDMNTGLKKGIALENAISTNFKSSMVKYLTFIQIHSDANGFNRSIALIQKLFPELYLVKGHTIAVFQTEKDLEKLKDSIKNIFQEMKIGDHGNGLDLEQEISFSIGVAMKKPGIAEAWFIDAGRALKRACVTGPNYFFVQGVT